MKQLVCIGVVLLGGCASTTSRFGTATMEADPSFTGLEGRAFQTTLSQAYTREAPSPVRGQPVADRGLCRYLVPGYQEEGSQPYARLNRAATRRGGQTGAAQFECLYLIPNPNQAQVDNHLDAGFALSDLYCEIYFRRISRRWNERVFLRNATNDVGAAISAVLGLTAAGSGVTGGVGAAFGLADALFRNYDDVFVVSPDLPTMQNLVKLYQRRLRDEAAVQANRPTNYYQAQARILDYARLCSYVGMRSLLNGAIDRTIEQLQGNVGTRGGIDRTLETSPVRAAVVSAATRRDQERQAIAEQRAAAREAEAAALERERAAQQRIDTPLANAAEPQL